MIDGHASLQSLQFPKAKRFSRTIVNNISKVYSLLKSPPRDLSLEKFSRVFGSHGFLTLSLSKYVRPGDINAFFPSPEKLLLAEKRILESEIKGIVETESRRTLLRPLELSQSSIVIAILGRTNWPREKKKNMFLVPARFIF